MAPEQLQLMHEVLDGEASAEDVRALKVLLEADPEAQTEFLALKRLFEELRAVPRAMVPDGLLSETLARLPPPRTRRSGWRQLSAGWRVFGSNSMRPRRIIRRGARNRDRPGKHDKGNVAMTESSKRKLWIGGGIAFVAAIVAARYFDLPPSTDMSGTIAPAARSVAPQPGAVDMTVSRQGDVQAAPVGADDTARDATARDAVGRDGVARDGVSRDASVRDGVARDGVSRDASVRDGVARDGVSRDASVRDGAARDGVSRDASVRDGAARDGVSRDASVRDGAARDGVSRDASVRDGVARDGVSRDASVRDGVARDGVSRDASVRDAASRDAASRDAASRDAAQQ